MKFEFKEPKLITWLLAKPKTVGLIVFLSLCFIVVFFASRRYLVVKENESREMQNVLNVVKQNIEQSLQNYNTTTLLLALALNDNGVPENFDYIGSKLIDSNPSIAAVELVPAGIIKYIYPLKGNENALNFDILKSPAHRAEALKSVETQKMYFAGPLVLQQGGMGIIGRLPVYKKNKFWGFSAVVIHLETLLEESGINSVEQSKYNFQFSKVNPVTKKEEFFLPYKKFAHTKYVSSVIPQGDWKLYLIPKYTDRAYSYIIFTTLFGIVLAALFGILLKLFLVKQRELQLLIHSQKGTIQSAEKKFKTIFEQAAVGIIHVDASTGKFLDVNNQYCKILGYSREELKNLDFQALTHPDDIENNVENLKNFQAGLIREYSAEKRYITKSGTVIWVNILASALWKSDKEPKTIITIIEDVTLKREAEELIRKSESHFRSLFEDSPVALWEEDFSQVKIYLGELQLLGKNQTEVSAFFDQRPEEVQKCVSLMKIIDVNNECVLMFYPKTKQELLNGVELLEGKTVVESFVKQLIAICSGQKYLVLNTEIPTASGKVRYIHFYWSAMKGSDETYERVILATEDITARKESEKLIIESQQKIEDLVNSIDGIVWECDYESLQLTFISKKCEDILGYTPEEWMADINFWDNLIYPDDKENTLYFFKKIKEENKEKDYEYRMISKDGSIIWVRELINIIFENGQPVSIRGILIDISKTKEAEQDLKSAFDLVTEQNKRLLNFSYIVSHNLRSHTSNIESITALIHSSDSEGEKAELLNMLKTVSASLNETMVNLNDVVNIQTNIGLISEKLNLKYYIDDVKSLLSEQILLKEVSITSNVADHVMVNYNPAYLQSVLFNIISNAVRYGHSERKPTIDIAWSKENDINVLIISDNGVGIDLVRNGDKLFGMYKTFSNNPDSRGIGLFITKNQIEAMGGKITVESQPNVGTRFKIYIK